MCGISCVSLMVSVSHLWSRQWRKYFALKSSVSVKYTWRTACTCEVVDFREGMGRHFEEDILSISFYLSISLLVFWFFSLSEKDCNIYQQIVSRNILKTLSIIEYQVERDLKNHLVQPFLIKPWSREDDQHLFQLNLKCPSYML